VRLASVYQRERLSGEVMSAELAAAAIGAIALLITTAFTVVYGPAWKGRYDRRRERAARSELLIARYSEPLARAAYDLQSRLYNILRLSFLQTYYKPKSYAEISTLWLIGQYLAWVEILRREVQVLDVGDSRRTAELQLRLFTVTDAFASDASDRSLAIFRQDQRAIGEIMVVSREVGDVKRSDCMGYVQFRQALDQDKSFSVWFERLRRDLDSLAGDAQEQEDTTGYGYVQSPRLILIQRALIDLIDFLDEDRIRFPSLNERGKIPLPEDVQIPKQPLSSYSVARFVYIEGDPWAIFQSWVAENVLTTTEAATSSEGFGERCAYQRQAWFGPMLVVKMFFTKSDYVPRVEIAAYALVLTSRVDKKIHIHLQESYRGSHFWTRRVSHLWTRQARGVVNDLLQKFDRPRIL
jgi:hypothetical protein